jgi:hypothetical protein
MFSKQISETSGRAELRGNGWLGARCFFTLSTGRSGTRTLAKLLDLADNAVVEHEPAPRLIRQCRDAYERWDQDPRLFKTLIEACREDSVFEAYEDGLIYGETANRLTFFAPALREVFTECRFIHLVRDPRDVVRSAMDRGWYSENKWDEGRIVPRPGDPFQPRWEGMDLFEKCAWYWHEVNRFACEFRAALPPGRAIVVKAEEIFSGDPERLGAVYDALGLEAPKPKAISKVLREKSNYQKHRSFLDPKRWSDQQLDALRAIAGATMEALGY